VRIDESAREILLLEAAALREAVADPAARAGYAELARAIAGGEIGDVLLPRLERLLELGLRTGRVRRVHGPHAEAAVTRVFLATPGGQALGAALAGVNEALQALRGRQLDGIAFSAKGPGAYALTIDTPTAKVTLEIGGEGVAVKEVNVGT
jgi:hypothetical protein